MYAFFPPSNAGVVGEDGHFDEGETWQEGFAGQGFDLLTGMLLEFGPSLGLDHTSVPSSTKNPFCPHRRTGC
ncbi:matrixin family metalloprotease [Streptomyces sp. NPDC041068]|uniref:matrixin family metalloprotease n=1 Tax=Streptomyces sp. NPDC041068 TaxID=3155130 RepID=UPI0033D7CEEB